MLCLFIFLRSCLDWLRSPPSFNQALAQLDPAHCKDSAHNLFLAVMYFLPGKVLTAFPDIRSMGGHTVAITLDNAYYVNCEKTIDQ